MTQRVRWSVVAALVLATGGTLGCPPDELPPDPGALEHAESILDAFYAWDEPGLRAAAEGAESASSLLYYQGWARGAHYVVQERRPCEGAGRNTVVCRVTVSDDFGEALGYRATDTFSFSFEGGELSRVEFGGDDPLVFTALFVWIAWDRGEIFENECEGMFEDGATPGACSRAVAAAARAFAERFGLAGEA